MVKVLRKIMSINLIFSMTMSLVITSYAEDISSEKVVVESITMSESSDVVESMTEKSSGDFNDIDPSEESLENEETSVVKTEFEADETIETTTQFDFIEETSSGQGINDYEKEVLERINEIIESNDISEDTHALIDEAALINEATYNEIEEIESDNSLLKDDGNFGAGNHTSNYSPSVVIHSTYDRYEIYTGENLGTVNISDDKGVYYNGNTNVKIIRDMIDNNNNSPILLSLTDNVQFFDFDNSNDNYVLLPDGFIEDIVAKFSGNGYLNPQGINKLDHIEVKVEFNNTDLGKYDLFEYGIFYYLSCYEGVLGEYYYYDPNKTDIDRAASFYINNRIMDRTYNIVSEYYYKSPSGEQLSFKPTWIINNENLKEGDRESYVKQWVNFPYFLIKTGEKYWNIRDSINDSKYLSEYSEGYYEQYLTEKPYGNVSEKLAALDNIYKTEEVLIEDSIQSKAVHPYEKSSSIEITGNFRVDKVNEEDKFCAGGMIPYETYSVLNVEVTDVRAKSVQVYLNGDKLIINNNKGLYTLTEGKCQIRIEGSKLYEEENKRNVVSILLLDEAGNYITDEKGRIINSYKSFIRSDSIKKGRYTVKFNTNGGSTLQNIKVEEGNILSLPIDPTKYSFIFKGWYNDSEYKDKFDEKEYIIGNKILYALWGQSLPKPITKEKKKPNSGGGSSGGSGGSGGGNGSVQIGISNVNTNQLNNTSKENYPDTKNAVSVRGNWLLEDNKWTFIDSRGEKYKNRWALINTSNNLVVDKSDWYRFDDKGNIVTGFYVVDDSIYCFNDGLGNLADEGKMLVGWHWLPSYDGGYCCYYFDTSKENNGMLVRDGVTRDGYRVDAFGRWIESGQIQRRTYR